MALSDAIKQINYREEFFDGYSMVTATYIGEESNLSSVASTNHIGGHFENDTNTNIKQSSLEKIESDRSKWTVVYQKNSSSGSGDDDYIKQTWACSMSQYEFPLERYLSADAASQVASWEETDNENKKAFKYCSGYSKDGTPTYTALTDKALAVAEKKFAGIESVIKFLPQATRTSLYNQKKSLESRAKKLNHIDTTPDSEFGSLSCSWLKSAFDWTQNNDGTWTLTESWLGSFDKWDRDLYSNNAWEFFNPTAGPAPQ